LAFSLIVLFIRDLDWIDFVLPYEFRFEDRQNKTSLSKKQEQAMFFSLLVFNFLSMYP